jgi:hypothetical protein
MPRRALWLALLVFGAHAAALLGAELAIAGELGPPIDDGWIYMAFARSLAAGEGITYPGHDGSVCAVTGPLWAAVLAVSFVPFGPSVAAAKALGVLSGALAILATARLACVATRDARVAAVAAVLMALTPRFVWGCLSVMPWPGGSRCISNAGSARFGPGCRRRRCCRSRGGRVPNASCSSSSRPCTAGGSTPCS